jgi:nitroreductase
VYKKKPVPKDIIVRLIEIARYAPTGHNSQTVEWLVVDNRDVLRRFAEIGADWMRWTIKNRPKSWELPSLIPHLERMLQRQERGENEFLRDAPAIVIAHAKKDDVFAPQSCAIALTYFDLIAYAMGLGCCWLGAFSDAATSFPPMIEALALPEGHQPFGSIAVGYSKFSYRRLPLRKYPPITWHA